MKYVSLDKKGCFWVRIVPPKHLLPLLPIKSSQYISSLGVVSKSKAESLAIPYINRWQAEINKAKSQYSNQSNLETLSVSELIGSGAEYSDEVQDKIDSWAYDGFYETARDGEGTEQRLKTVSQMGKGVLSEFYLDAYAKSLEGLKPKTIKQRISRIKKEFIPNFIFLDKESLGAFKIQQWVNSYITREPKVSYKTLKSYYLAARGYVGWLILSGYLNHESDPFSLVKIPAKYSLKKGVVRKEFNDDDLSLILKNIKNKDNELKVLVKMAMFTGCRIEELAKLKSENISEKEGVLTIEITESKTDAGKRVIPVHFNIGDEIKKRAKAKGYIFPIGSSNYAGNRSDMYSKAFGRLKTRLGFGEEYVFHSIRKTFVTKMERLGIPESIVADIVGHNKQTITFGIYSGGSSLQQKLEAINKLDYTC